MGDIALLNPMRPTPLSVTEGLEQMAWIDHGWTIMVDAILDRIPLSINTPEDLARFRQELARAGAEG